MKVHSYDSRIGVKTTNRTQICKYTYIIHTELTELTNLGQITCATSDRNINKVQTDEDLKKCKLMKI